MHLSAAETAKTTLPTHLQASGKPHQPTKEPQAVASQPGPVSKTGDPAPGTRLDLLRALPSFGFEMVGDEPRTDTPES
ncbi:hypothetical protein A5N17_06420 [Arthrobacter sp. D2]|nr:hypothetical protein [Arthrobacter sp. M5]NKR16446.1 hypothetical protein [Arthrobacter sp. M6]OEH61442.1 hypothetical protein A5N13_17025 [Arthrobacter sp. D4]OEH64428.1 hypothetical protein A5N17_06420 [Arthrobacter sp. D2]